jgi:hypothetical protein
MRSLTLLGRHSTGKVLPISFANQTTRIRTAPPKMRSIFGG